jgi:hypothetical protein
MNGLVGMHTEENILLGRAAQTHASEYLVSSSELNLFISTSVRHVAIVIRYNE